MTGTAGSDTRDVFPMSGAFKEIQIVSRGTADFDNIKVYQSSIEYDRVPVSVCANELPYQFGAQLLSEPGEYEEIFQSVMGCDSTVFIQFEVLPVSTHEFSESVCVSYTWNSETYTTSGDKIQIFPAANGCDSIVTLHLTIYPLPEVPTYESVTNVGDYTLPAVKNGVWTNANGNVVTVAKTNGVYTLTITGEGGCKNSTTLTVTFEKPTGIEDILAGKLVIYPNPAKDEVFIKSELPNRKIEILDLTGRIVMFLQNGASTINVSALPQGVYMLKVYTDSGVVIAKMVK